MPIITKTLSLLPGCNYHPHRDWNIGPVGHSRDSDMVEECNWDSVVAEFTRIDPDQTTWDE